MERHGQNYIMLHYRYHLTEYFMRMITNDDDVTTIIQDLHDGQRKPTDGSTIQYKYRANWLVVSA
jgi:hypothetical protein